jgi:hypothetical protein
MTPYEIGQFVGGIAALAVVRFLVGGFVPKWPPSVTRLVFINLFSFLLASWLYAHGTAISAAQDTVELSALHIYFFPQLVIFGIDLCVYFLRLKGKMSKVEKDHPVRVEPTF